MKILVIGAGGRIGSAVVRDLLDVQDVDLLGVLDCRKDKLESLLKWMDPENRHGRNVNLHQVDCVDIDEIKKVMSQYDVGVITLPDRKASYKTVQTAISAGLNIVDVLEEYHRRPDSYETEGLEIPDGVSRDRYGEWLHEYAVSKGVTFLDGMGLAPGITNVVAGEGIRKLDNAITVIARVGGIPTIESAQRHPLGYMITWAFWHVLREYMIKVKVIKNGQVIEVDAMSDLETFIFTSFGKNEQLECAITPGMPSFIFTRPYLNEFSEKTVRWPGHYQKIGVLKECGLLDLDPLKSGSDQILPRQFLSQVITPRLIPQQGDTDVCVMWCSVTGMKDGKPARVDYRMWNQQETASTMTSMEKVTGSTAAIGAWMLGKGLIREKGILAPEDCIEGKNYQIFIDELKKRQIIIQEVESLN
jgi:lysine 6-dehydrogenase